MFSSRAATVAKAFKTALSERRFAGRTLRTVDRNLTIPASLSGIVVGTVGLTQSLATPSDSHGATTTTTSVGTDAATARLRHLAALRHVLRSAARQAVAVLPSLPPPQPWDTCGYRRPPGALRLRPLGQRGCWRRRQGRDGGHRGRLCVAHFSARSFRLPRPGGSRQGHGGRKPG